ncbi:diacylglycerol/lipid kinase family protein [Algicella marina]|nr:YegS/Rv2252/BmrU family lipid kinase [Algicella marina]
MGNKACAIINRKSGRGSDEESFAQTLKLLEDRGVEAILLKKPADMAKAVDEAVAKGFDPIIAAGGDGTICGVTEALRGKGPRLGVLPLGTFNYFARSLGLPEDAEKALDVALNGADSTLSFGEINGKVFLNNASIGAYAAVLEVREDIYKNWGRSRLAAYWSVIVAMATLYRSLKMKITVDGKVHQMRSPVAFVAIRAYQLAEFDLEGVEEIEDGKMALLAARDSGRWMLLWRAMRIFFRGARKGQDYVLLSGKEIDIETSAARRFARDGERERMAGPYRFRLKENAIPIRVPHPEENEA